MLASASDNYLDISALSSIKTLSKKDEKAALEQVASQFETIFMKMMLKSMRDASFGNPLFDSESAKVYRDMHDDQLALNLSKSGGVGIADMLVKQLGRYIQSDENKSVKPEEFPIMNAAVSSVANSQTENKLQERIKTFESPKDFVKELWPSAVNAAKKIGASPKVLIAQAALETGWGKYMIQAKDGGTSHNLFNIKADHRWNGESSSISTVEYLAGQAKTKRAEFRVYDSFQESFDDYIAFLKQSPRYEKALQHASDDVAFVQNLQAGGYATDPKYAQKIQRILGDKPLNEALSSLKITQDEMI